MLKYIQREDVGLLIVILTVVHKAHALDCLAGFVLKVEERKNIMLFFILFLSRGGS